MTVEGQAQVPDTQASETQVSEAQIAVHWREEEYYQPSAGFIAQANGADPAPFKRLALQRFPECFREYADLLTWDAYWHTTLDTSEAPFWRWLVGGWLNACFNCVDRHLAGSRNKAALVWVPEPEGEAAVALTCQEPFARVNEFAALLRGFCDVGVGDRVHLPPADGARAAGVHAGLRAHRGDPLRGVRRVQRRCVRRADRGLGQPRPGDLGRLPPQWGADRSQGEGRRGGRGGARRASRWTRSWRRHPGRYASRSPMVAGRDFFVDELLADYRGRMVEPVSMPAEAPRFVMYTSAPPVGRRVASIPPAATWPMWQAPRSTTRTSTRQTPTGASRTSGGSPGIPYIVYGPPALGRPA